MKTFYPIHINDLKHQVDSVTPQKNWVFEVYDEDPTHTTLYNILLKQSGYRKISEEKKLMEFIFMNDNS